jgi:tetratricopeptide (TPR) repeat protein
VTEPDETGLALAEFYVDVGRPERALEVLAGLGSEAIEDPHAWFVRAHALVELERWDAASSAAASGLALDPDRVELLHLRALALWRRGELAGAESAVLAALELTPEDPVLLCTYAHLVASAGQLDKAERLVDEASRLDPDDAYVRRTRAELAYLSGRDAAAERHARGALELDPEDADSLTLMGVAAYQRGHGRRGAADVRRAAGLDPSSENHVMLAREMSGSMHPLLLPLWPIYRFGRGPVWIAGVAALFAVARLDAPAPLAAAVVILWLVFVAYSWIAPPLVQRWLERRRP